MAPEQAHAADKVDARSDIYAVGVMLYEMISGSRPATGDDARVVALKVERGEVRPLVHAAPGVPPDLAGLVHRAIAYRPELRFGTATEMRSALEAAAGKRAATGAHVAVPTGPPPRVSHVPQDAAWPSPGHGGDPRTPSVVPGHAASTNPSPPPSFSSSPPPAGSARSTVISNPTGESLRPAEQTSTSAFPPGAYGAAPRYPGYQTPAGYPVDAPRKNKKGVSPVWLLIGLPIVLGTVIVLASADREAAPVGPAGDDRTVAGDPGPLVPARPGGDRRPADPGRACAPRGARSFGGREAAPLGVAFGVRERRARAVRVGVDVAVSVSLVPEHPQPVSLPVELRRRPGDHHPDDVAFPVPRRPSPRTRAFALGGATAGRKGDMRASGAGGPIHC
jgi:serine/threonine-protein kinase